MTFATNIFVISESDTIPMPSYSIIRQHEDATLAGTITALTSADSFDSDCCDMDINIIEEQENFVTYQTLNDCQEQQESLIDDGTESDDDGTINRENSDDSLLQMLSSVGFSIKKRVTFKPMVKVIHFESAELAEKYAMEEAERQRMAKIAEESKSFVSGVKFFVGNNFDDNDCDGDLAFDY